MFISVSTVHVQHINMCSCHFTFGKEEKKKKRPHRQKAILRALSLRLLYGRETRLDVTLPSPSSSSSYTIL